MKAIVYFRVSTQRQGEAGNGLDAQRDAVQDWCCAKGCEILQEFVEIESGRKNYRPQLLAAIEECRKSGAVLIVAKLDRLARNLSFIANLMDSQVKFVALDMPNMDDPDVSRLTIQLLASIAEFESRRISRRTREGLAQVRKHKALGSPLSLRSAPLLAVQPWPRRPQTMPCASCPTSRSCKAMATPACAPWLKS
jgi:DNA invertase Pin-like site-specific DNA recombinase